MAHQQIIKPKRNATGKQPSASDLSNNEIAISYTSNSSTAKMYIKGDDGVIKTIGSESDSFVKRLVGTQADPIVLSSLTTGSYEVFGHYKISPTDTVRTQFVSIPFLGIIEISGSTWKMNGIAGNGTNYHIISQWGSITSNSISGNIYKYFNHIPQINSGNNWSSLQQYSTNLTPTSNTHLVHKKYVDELHTAITDSQIDTMFNS